MSTTPNLGLALPLQGSQAWDGPLNNNFTKLDSLGGGTAGQVLTSNGPNTAPTFQLAIGLLQLARVTLSAAQIKNLVASPVEIIAAPGSNKIILPQSWFTYFKKVATFSTGGTLQLQYESVTGTSIFSPSSGSNFAGDPGDVLFNQNILDGSNNILSNFTASPNPINSGIQLFNASGSNYSNDGNGTLTVAMYYTIVTLV